MSTNNNRSEQTKKTGRSKRGSYDKISIQKREKAVEIYQNTIGISINKIAIQARLPKSTCYNIIKRYEETGSVVTKKRGGEKKGDLGKAHVAYLTRLLDEQAITTAKELKTKMMEGLSGTADLSGLSVSSIQRCIKANIGFSLKRKLRYPMQRNDEEILQKRYEFVQKLFLESIDYRLNCIFVEESGFNLWLIKGQAYSPKIDKPNVPIYRSRARNISIVAAISSNGVEYSTANLMLSSANGGVSTQYLKDLIQTIDEQNRPNQTFVMDELSLINAMEVKEMFSNPACRHELLFIPPWSPFLNPVEGLFTKVLSNVSRNSTDDTEEIKNAIMSALATVTVADCQQWIGTPLNFYHQCFQKQDWIG